MNESLKLAVVGVGALGRHHARILSEMEGVELVAVAEPNEKQGLAVAEACGCDWTNDYRTLLKSVDAVSVVVPTFLHRKVGEAFLSNSVPVLMEKPLTSKVEDGEVLVRLAQEHGIPLQVGHIERFNPGFQQLADWTSEPKYLRTERVSPYAFRSMDIGVVHDLMIHDIELCLSLTQEMPSRVEAFGVSLVGGHEDVVQARLSFPNGCIADLTVNRVTPQPARTIQCWSDAGCAIADLTARTVQTFSPSEMMQAGQLPFELAQAGIQSVDDLKPQVFGGFIDRHQFQATDTDALTAELSSFVDCVRNRHQPVVSGAHGLAALRVAQHVLECVEAHQWDGVPDGRTGAKALLKHYLGQTHSGEETDAAAA
ncbi:Gfo/Idh/MocA family oxidoreductase [Thalassoglobus sp.]|uniref:Gfo/Idh/MocA family oxidoreductase n=1 Tax=Thalassoglobus sp. TaxID=2795869 RepID=UPI003AA9B458